MATSFLGEHFIGEFPWVFVEELVGICCYVSQYSGYMVTTYSKL